MKIINITIEALPGDSINETILEAKCIAAWYDCTVSFRFNGVPLQVEALSITHETINMYHNKLRGLCDEHIMLEKEKEKR